MHSLEEIKHREAWTFRECSRIWGHRAEIFSRAFKQGLIRGYTVSEPGAKRHIKLFAYSVRAYMESLAVSPQPVKAKRLTMRQLVDADPEIQRLRAQARLNEGEK